MNPLARWLLDSESILPPAHRMTHTYVIGQPGTGKSRALESWALQDILAGHGVAVIDPHGDVYRHLVAHLATKPEVGERVILLDPCDPQWVIGFNPLEAIQGVSQERAALFLTDVVVKVWKLNTATAPRMVWLLTNTFLALANLGLTLLDLPRFLLDADFREHLLPRLTNDHARAYFALEFPQNQSAVHQWVTPVLNKIGSLIFDPDTRLMVAGRASLNFREILDRKRILLVNLPKGIIGEGASALLGAFIVAHFQKAALSRANVNHRQPYYLYLDEFQNYTTDNIQDILSESRKYGLSLTLAHQYLDQLSTDLRSAVLNTTGTLASFRVGYGDAYQLAKEIFPSSDFLSEARPELRLRRLTPWPILTVRERHESEGWEHLAHQLTGLSSRQFWMRRRGPQPPAKLRTLNMPDPALTPELVAAIHALRDSSGARYGRWKKDVAAEVRHDRYGFTNKNRPQTKDGSRPGDVPMWSD